MRLSALLLLLLPPPLLLVVVVSVPPLLLLLPPPLPSSLRQSPVVAAAAAGDRGGERLHPRGRRDARLRMRCWWPRAVRGAPSLRARPLPLRGLLQGPRLAWWPHCWARTHAAALRTDGQRLRPSCRRWAVSGATYCSAPRRQLLLLVLLLLPPPVAKGIHSQPHPCATSTCVTLCLPPLPPPRLLAGVQVLSRLSASTTAR